MRRTFLIAIGMVGMSALATSAHAQKPAPGPSESKSPAWLGVFHPTPAPGTCAAACETAGTVRVFDPANGGPAADGSVVIVQPVSGKHEVGQVVHGVVAVHALHFDPTRDNETGVLVLPAKAEPALAAADRNTLASVRAAVAHEDELGGVKRALVGLEVGTVTLDGEAGPAYAVTYGCAQWSDGNCQARGQFFYAWRGRKWVEIE